MKIATYNVNSIRRRLPIVLEWLEKHEPDIMCLQETKVQDNEFPALAMEAAGYYASFRGMKAYSGVATLSKKKPERVLCGLECGNDPEDIRILMAVLDGVPIVNTYVPQGYKIGTDKYAFKLEWLRKLRTYFERHLDPAKAALWVGDLNVAPEPIDVYHPDRRVKDVDFHIDARNAYKETASWGFVDVFRKLHPDRIQYTYWDYFRNAFEKGPGAASWRTGMHASGNTRPPPASWSAARPERVSVTLRTPQSSRCRASGRGPSRHHVRTRH